jgi:hypothetical protein
MSQPPILYREPRKLTLLELVDIHLLVKASNPMLCPQPKVEPCKPEKEQAG